MVSRVTFTHQTISNSNLGHQHTDKKVSKPRGNPVPQWPATTSKKALQFTISPFKKILAVRHQLRRHLHHTSASVHPKGRESLKETTSLPHPPDDDNGNSYYEPPPPRLVFTNSPPACPRLASAILFFVSPTTRRLPSAVLPAWSGLLQTHIDTFQARRRDEFRPKSDWSAAVSGPACHSRHAGLARTTPLHFVPDMESCRPLLFGRPLWPDPSEFVIWG